MNKYALLFIFSLSFSFLANALPTAAPNKGEQQCTDCHQNQVNDWKKSDHAKAMDIANEKSVLANFDNVTVKHFSQTARFYKKGNEFWADHSYNDKKTSYKISYTFGHYPLQQFLVKSEHGKYQVFPFSWDSRPKTQGGQRWYPVYPDEDIQKNDRLHWQQPLQTWNGMCADCHSDGLKRNYSVEKNTFDTTWDNINVGCQSCHGKMDEHRKNPKKSDQPKYSNQWLIEAGTPTAKWQGAKRDNSFMDNCFACHALRSPLTDGIEANKPFLDQFSPSFVNPTLYHHDGQIKEEVYVYGSFLQSKMFAAGVNCIDCHDKHTMKIKIPDNGLCLQCHNAQVFDQPEHHHHQEKSEGSQCVNCHMPENRYMGVDDRRDHSFKIPRPHLSNSLDTPNACTQCHDDKDNDWATKAVEGWNGKPKALTSSEQTFLTLQQGFPVPMPEHLALINDSKMNEIYRATAISLLPTSTGSLTDAIIKPWVNSPENLIRLATARVGNLLPPAERSKSFIKLISDKYKAVRAAAASHVLAMTNVDKTQLASAFKELQSSNEINSWRGEGNLNRSIAHLANGKVDEAISAVKNAIKVDPYFPASYINLADMYRNKGDAVNEKLTYEQGLKAAPTSGLLHYSYGLHLIRLQQKSEAMKSFVQALKIEPSNSQYAYIYILALDSTGQTKQALAKLKMIISRFKHDPQMVQLGLNLAQKMQDQQAYQFFLRYMPQ